MDDVKVSTMSVTLPNGSDLTATSVTRSEGLEVEASTHAGALMYIMDDGTRVNVATVAKRGSDGLMYIIRNGLDEKAQTLFAVDPGSLSGAVIVTESTL